MGGPRRLNSVQQAAVSEVAERVLREVTQQRQIEATIRQQVQEKVYSLRKQTALAVRAAIDSGVPKAQLQRATGLNWYGLHDYLALADSEPQTEEPTGGVVQHRGYTFDPETLTLDVDVAWLTRNEFGANKRKSGRFVYSENRAGIRSHDDISGGFLYYSADLAGSYQIPFELMLDLYYSPELAGPPPVYNQFQGATPLVEVVRQLEEGE